MENHKFQATYDEAFGQDVLITSETGEAASTPLGSLPDPRKRLRRLGALSRDIVDPLHIAIDLCSDGPLTVLLRNHKVN
ncbi:hypothetical protein NPX13_g9298 [Xylaria arbuscula]|uniref:Uncharacterized protein n=1 Tax=Xylaria arbuscula TaxID=114810 RepID=A0A9W8N6U6_9PEZI|nr:hypothetical protein NPX13_g9298 [Xylaria arbuscula]